MQRQRKIVMFPNASKSLSPSMTVRGPRTKLMKSGLVL